MKFSFCVFTAAFEDSFEKVYTLLFTEGYMCCVEMASAGWDHLIHLCLSSSLFLVSDVKKVNRKSETKRYSEIFREFDNLDLSLLSS